MLEGFTDYYSILGIPRYTNRDGIRRAYLRKARQYHPDLHPDDPYACLRMSAVNVAYSILSDADRRAQYDSQRTVLHMHMAKGDAGSVSRSHHMRYAQKKNPGAFETAMAMMLRLFHDIAAVLPA